MKKMLIVDSGSTKTQWAYVGEKGEKGEKRTYTTGTNPLFVSENEMTSLVMSVVQETGAEIEEVYFYGSGCIDEAHSQVVMHAFDHVLGNGVRVEIWSDMLGAARSLFGKEEGVACILGTGSNSCYYNGSEIVRNVRSLGYILGDEGSGTCIGKMLVSDCLKGLCSKELQEALHAWCNMTYSEIIEKVYRKPFANRFLSRFAMFASEHIENPEVEAIVRRSFEFFAVRCLEQYDETRTMPVSFVGSVAKGFEPILRQTLEEHSMKVGTVAKDPMEGLVKFHKALG